MCLFISEVVGALYVARGGYSREYEQKGERKLSTTGGRCKLNLVAKEVITAGTCPSLLHGVYARRIMGLWKKSSASSGSQSFFFVRKRGSYVIRMRKLYVHLGQTQQEPDNYNSIIIYTVPFRASFANIDVPSKGEYQLDLLSTLCSQRRIIMEFKSILRYPLSFLIPGI